MMHSQAALRPERDLADPDSLFRKLGKFEVHYKRFGSASTPIPAAKPSAQPQPQADISVSATQQIGGAPEGGNGALAQGPLAIACYHGFGANTFSWAAVQEQLAQKLQAVVVAHDMPGFGLTQR